MVPQGAGVRVPENPIGDGPGRHAMVSDVANAPLAQLAEQRTLNPRVRGSSPWRRTRDDLGFHLSRSIFMCPVCPHVGSMFARELGPGRGGLCQIWPERGLRRLTWVGQWSTP